MDVSQHDFLMNAMKILYASLNPEVTFPKLYAYLQSFFPVSGMYLFSSPQNRRYTTRLAEVSEQDVQFFFDDIYYTEHQRQLLTRILETDALQLKRYGVQITDASSLVAQFSVITGEKYGKVPFVWLRLSGEDQTIFGTAVISLTKPVSDEQLEYLRLLAIPLRFACMNIVKQHELEMLNDQMLEENTRLRQRNMGNLDSSIIGQNSGLKKVVEKVRMCAPIEVPVLITGETGTGKDLIAQALAKASKRSGKPFVAVNCGAIPKELIESQLFGHVRGAFTGATSNHIGYFEQADKGILFLDEVGELPLESQVRLLRVLEKQEIRRVGDTRDKKVDVRIISATNKDLKYMVDEGNFREDLYYRLRGVEIRIPPLRERKQDIPALVHFFMKTLSAKYGIVKPVIDNDSIKKLEQYDWPGNVRELKNVLGEALIYSAGSRLDITLPNENASRKSADGKSKSDMPEPYETVLCDYLKECLSYTHGRINGPHGAALLTGLTPGCLRAKCRKYGIEPRKFF